MNIQKDTYRKYRSARADCFIFAPTIIIALFIGTALNEPFLHWLVGLMVFCYLGMIWCAFRLYVLSEWCKTLEIK